MLTALIASNAGSGIVIAIGGIVAVLAISALFYAVGRSEDREREQAAAARAAAAAAEEDDPPAAASPPPPAARPAGEEPHPRLRRPDRPRRRR